MEKIKEGAKYFRENEGYTRLFKKIKEKYIQIGEMKGNIIIAKPTALEKEVLSGLMKKDYLRNTTITINLKKLQETLNKTKYEGIELIDLVEEYFKEKLITKKENRERNKNEMEIFFGEILNENKNTYIYDYLQKSISHQDELYQNIKRHYKIEKEEEQKERINANNSIKEGTNNKLKEAILNACKGINSLPEQKTRIPVFATNILSNPHGYDKKTLCGRLFILLLCYINNISYPKNSEELYEIYYNSNLLVDDISNMVLCKNIIGITVNDRYIENGLEVIDLEEHGGMKGYYKYNEPIFLTLYNLSNIKGISVLNRYNKVVITENPAVFMAIMEKCKIKDFPLICTYGQVKLAGIMLLDLLVEQDFKLYYTGDLDPEGIQIADKLKHRYKNSLELIGFNKKQYYKNISNIEVSNSRLQKLEKIKSHELIEIAEEIKKQKKSSI